MPAYLTPAVTPLKDGKIDYPSLKKLYDHLIDGGVDGILVLGSIGEFFAFDLETKKELVSFAQKTIAGRTRLIVGATSMVYEEIVELSQFAYDQGVSSVMVIPPYYFHFNGEEIYQYYHRLAGEVPGELYLYNFPDRTGYEIPVEVIRRLALEHPNIMGIKDTIGGVDHTREIIKAVKSVRPEFQVYSGFDDNFLHNVMCGGDGCIAGLSNLYPELTSSWVRSVKEGDMEKASAIQRKIDRLMDIYGVGKPFVPYIKGALCHKGIIAGDEATFPMPKLTQEDYRRITEIMEEYEDEHNS